jgi:predicted hotdog family 3-hydroxylacyl-ACP dehydratase
MPLNRDWIAAHIPHRGRMCLLDEVLEWDAQQIRCSSRSHRAADNPLRAHGRLGSACGIEYAAQAMALHGALAKDAAMGGADPKSDLGFLASVRDVHLMVVRLDDIESDLICEAARLAGDNVTALYEFALRAGERILLSGRAAVILDAQRPGNE